MIFDIHVADQLTLWHQQLQREEVVVFGELEIFWTYHSFVPL
jgi:hypothetical protein